MNLVTNIQKYSIHDGDGIRTTVFFKGCPLKCEWCHNPETQRFERELQCDKEKCVGCGTCAKVCPNDAITMVDGKPELDKEKCQLCGKCDNFCPQGIREIVGQEYPVKELVKELMKDRMFYEQSGGGVTLSGGEVMAMSTDYILQIAKALKKEEISLTIDTCGFVSYDKFEAILPYVNTFLYDIKEDRLIGAAIVGTGLPMVCHERELFKDYYDEKKGKGFDYSYLYPGVNKVFQAGGRVIRTVEDRGVILLLDERFLERQYTSLFPREWYPYEVVDEHTLADSLKKFWQ